MISYYANAPVLSYMWENAVIPFFGSFVVYHNTLLNKNVLM